ncbi:MAG: FeoB-associated Cys-rich membrane protein [Bacteroidales bacterium]|nr:FeoB-associated Cys-rich membrane protein [Bacteroidales bacterium]
MSITLQWIIVTALVVSAVVFFVHRRRRQKSRCDGCPISDSCRRSRVTRGERPRFRG